MNQVATIEKRSVLIDMATRYGMEPAAFEQTLRATVVPKDCGREQFAAFLLVAKEYGLNPITKEIYAFPTRGGGIQPIVGIDGWMNLINSHPNMDGLEFDDHLDGDTLAAVTARIWRKDRAHPIVVTEYMAECARSTEPWKQWPRRMLRHKAAIQCARYAFGFAGIIDPDEAERSPDVVSPMKDVTPPSPPQAPPAIAAPAAEPAIDGERFLQDLDEQMAGAETEAILNEIWDTNAEPRIADLTAADAARANKLYRDHVARLAG
jgi:phage recombination protein Bet